MLLVTQKSFALVSIWKRLDRQYSEGLGLLEVVG
jgi:hypothetical protein